MAEPRSLKERLLDVTVFLPVGVAVTVAGELPGLAGKGRERVTKNVEVARVIGRMAVAEAQRRLKAAPGTAGSTGRGDSPAAPRPPEPDPRPARPRPARPPGSSRQQRPVAHRPSQGAKGAPPVDASKLPIPGYSTLAASQVVQRLASLSPRDLEAVRRYEAATRGRRTILHRIAQLNSSGPKSS